MEIRQAKEYDNLTVALWYTSFSMISRLLLGFGGRGQVRTGGSAMLVNREMKNGERGVNPGWDQYPSREGFGSEHFLISRLNLSDERQSLVASERQMTRTN